MPFVVGEVEVTNEVSLAPNSVLKDGAIEMDGDLSIKINSFYYNINGTQGKYAGAIGLTVTDNTVNYVWLDGSANIQITTGSYPSVSTVSLRLGRVVASGGFITRIILERAFLTAISSGSAAHASLRQLIHLAHNGPFETFASGAYRETVGGVFPSAVIWYNDNTKAKKIVEKGIAYNPNKTVSQIVFKVYDTDGITVLATATDNITYSGVFETSRVRTIA
jgi:hypothetical protein